MKTHTYTNTDNKVINLDGTMETSECDSCSNTFPLCMIENTEDLCCKRVSEVMQRIFIEQ